MSQEEKISYTRPTDLSGVEVLSVENSLRAWSWFHVTYSVCTGLACEGAVEWAYRGKHYATPAGQLMLLEPGETHHTAEMRFPCTFKVLLVAPALIEDLAAESGVDSRFHFSSAVATDRDIYREFVAMHEALDQDATLLERQARLTDCLGLLVSRHGECRRQTQAALPARRCLRQARDHLEAEFAENISLDDLAKTAGLSRFHFLRAFKHEFGLPPHAYQMNLRVQRVRGWLKAGMAIKDIEAGFADQSHLTRHFKRIFGVTPAAYAAVHG